MAEQNSTPVGRTPENLTTVDSPSQDVTEKSGLSQLPNRVESSVPAISGRAEDTKEFVIRPKNGFDEAALSKTESHIEAVTQSTSVFSYRNSNKELVAWVAPLTASQLHELQQDDGVRLIEENIIVGKLQRVPFPSQSAVAQLSDQAPNKAKRAVQYATQTTPASELIMISQPTTVPNVDSLENYVYESHAGEGTFIYHVELGISKSMTDEFPPGQVEILRTPLAIKKGVKEDTDDSPKNKPSHSTCTASKAMGQRYGSAKKSTLVVVKMSELTLIELEEVFDIVWQDISEKKRQKKSVVTVSWLHLTPVDPNNLSESLQKQRDWIAILLQNDVPVVVGSGNDARTLDGNGKARANVDCAPAVFAADDFPLIVVGATDVYGRPAYFSQGGEKVKVLAPADRIECPGIESKDSRIDSGTSFAAPLVAGLLATFLAYDTVPFDMSDGHVAANAKAYLANTASWSRHLNYRVIWNGVTEADNPQKQHSAEKLECHGVSGNAWVVNRNIAIKNIADFCSQDQRSVEYNQGTDDDLIFTASNPSDSVRTPQDAPDCHDRLSNFVIDGCDGNDGVNNPHNYKYGGTYTATDGWVYMMEPKAIHVDDDNCDISFRFVDDLFEVRGMNFPDAKLGVNGEGLLDHIRGCSPVTGWYFAMTPHDVKYQWYASGYILVGQRSCVGRAVEAAGGSTTGNCNGNLPRGIATGWS